MLHKQAFTVEPLESRLEQFCIYIPGLGICYKQVWFVLIPYPCVKLYRVCY